MLTLGIETSCDETSVSVTSGRRVLSNIVSSSVRLHKKYGGVVPEIASRFHVEYILEVLSEALRKGPARLKDIKLIAVTNGPGLVGALLTGISLGKSLSLTLGVPLVGVNHVLAHLYSAFLEDPSAGSRSKAFPFIGLVVSGGHTALFLCQGRYKQKLLGQTQDDAVGEAFDKVAKILKLGYPGGPVIEKRASLSKGPNKINFPKTYLGKDSLDFSFSGIKTAVLYYVRNTQYAIRNTGSSITNDICYAFQEAALNELVERAFLAARLHKVKDIVVGGGVAANSRLREKFSENARFSEGVRIYFPEKKYCTDNAAMVGSLGEEMYKQGKRSDLYLSAEPNLEVVNVK
ncbi:MAG: tRNA (adenosine(37)-N6)-threonylcarbamoyltransferase complex transferase subunit TsaD [Candidatus Omnitrophica bacterium]|nr:tRNA (adenosine(37)-N6)-threonylcarbamoyltransferase complex transferase subunit TsaD [Candidatus Omnitrophota bacterium]